MNRALLVALGGALIVVAAAAWWWMEQAGRDDVAVQIDPNDAELVAIGERIYAQQCASCHGVG
ncbi:MAG: cytochrome c, partial [Rhodospirillaceae bacterium]